MKTLYMHYILKESTSLILFSKDRVVARLIKCDSKDIYNVKKFLFIYFRFILDLFIFHHRILTFFLNINNNQKCLLGSKSHQHIIPSGRFHVLLFVICYYYFIYQCDMCFNE